MYLKLSPPSAALVRWTRHAALGLFIAQGLSGASVVNIDQPIPTSEDAIASQVAENRPGAPVITKHPQSQKVEEGQRASFSVKAKGDYLTYQWYRNGHAITGATSGFYRTPATAAQDDGARFKVKVSNSKGAVVSQSATLTVGNVNNSPHTDAAPSITKQPKSCSAYIGDKATFTVVAQGKYLKYQWYKNNQALSDGHTATYTLSNVTNKDHGARFKVEVSNKAGSVYSQNAKLTVKEHEGKKPVITEHPESQTAEVGEKVTFTVSATGKNLTYQWYKNDSVISEATKATYTIRSVKKHHNGSKFSVKVSNISGSVMSYVATLTVNEVADKKPVITEQPESVTVKVGEKATFSVVATGKNLSYKWYRNNTVISGATSDHYTIPSVKASDNGGKFKVKVSNNTGSVYSQIVTLTVSNGDTDAMPVITEQPESQTVSVGDTVEFSVGAEGKQLRYQWYRNNVSISGATSSHYTLQSANMSDNGATFHVQVRNDAGGIISAKAVLTVNESDEDKAPVITEQPESQTVTVGESVTFSVTATGDNLKFQWIKNGEVVTGVTGSDYTMEAVKMEDDGTEIQVVVSNSAGSIKSSVANLTVEEKD